VRAVVGGDALPSPVVTRRLIGEFAARAKKVQPSAALDALTERERDVVALVAPGPHQRRDCRAPGYQPSDDEDVRQPSDDQGRRAGSGPTGGARLQVGPGPPRLGGLRSSVPATPGVVPARMYITGRSHIYVLCSTHISAVAVRLAFVSALVHEPATTQRVGSTREPFYALLAREVRKEPRWLSPV
jgi:hypothetical protein